MTERQRLITKYLSRLYPATETYYRLHFLRGEKDESSVIMLLDELNKTYKETDNYVLGELIKEIQKDPKYNKLEFGQHYSKKKNQMESGKEFPEPKSQQVSNIQNAGNQFHSLNLEDALKSFNKIIKDKNSNSHEMFFKERIEINLLLKNCREALLLAQKALSIYGNSNLQKSSALTQRTEYSDMAFVAAFASGKFEVAKQYIDDIVNIIIENAPERRSVASPFELIHLVFFVFLATSSPKETSVKANRIFDSSNYDLTELFDIMTSFYDNNFSELMRKIPRIRDIFAISIYTSPIIDQFVSAITQNIIILYLSPIASATIGEIAAHLQISTDNAVFYIRKGIREGKLEGKLNLTSMTYAGSIVLDNNTKEMVKIYEETISIRHEFELGLWVSEYNATKPYKPPK